MDGLAPFDLDQDLCVLPVLPLFAGFKGTTYTGLCINKKAGELSLMQTLTVGTISLGRISDICSFRQCGKAQLHTSVAVRLSIASQPAWPSVYGLAGAESDCGACEVSLKATGP